MIRTLVTRRAEGSASDEAAVTADVAWMAADCGQAVTIEEDDS